MDSNRFFLNSLKFLILAVIYTILFFVVFIFAADVGGSDGGGYILLFPFIILTEKIHEQPRIHVTLVV